LPSLKVVREVGFCLVRRLGCALLGYSGGSLLVRLGCALLGSWDFALLGGLLVHCEGVCIDPC
jgi:hypothetical protein